MESNSKLSKYEDLGIKEIHMWKDPKLSWLDKAMEVINIPLNKAGGLVNNIPGFDWVINKSIGGLVSWLNDLAHWSVRAEIIFEEYRNMGHRNITKSKDILELDLEDVDKVIGYLGVKYKSLSAIEGAAAGYVGLPGIPADIVALVAMSQRAIGEYATYCGFDVNSQVMYFVQKYNIEVRHEQFFFFFLMKCREIFVFNTFFRHVSPSIWNIVVCKEDPLLS